MWNRYLREMATYGGIRIPGVAGRVRDIRSFRFCYIHGDSKFLGSLHCVHSDARSLKIHHSFRLCLFEPNKSKSRYPIYICLFIGRQKLQCCDVYLPLILSRMNHKKKNPAPLCPIHPWVECIILESNICSNSVRMPLTFHLTKGNQDQ